jgi:hypothetical protein
MTFPHQIHQSTHTTYRIQQWQVVTQANQRARTKEGKPKDEHGDLFAKVQNHTM